MNAAERNKPWQHDHWKNAGGANAQLPSAFFNDLDPQLSIKRETPLHRRCAELFMQGFTHKEIGAMVGRTAISVSNVLRQPYARVYMQEQVKRTVKDEMTAFLDEQLMTNLRTLAAIRDEANDPKDKIAAIRELNDRRLGKPTQPIANVDKPASALSGAELEAEVARIVALNATENPASPSGDGEENNRLEAM